MRVPYIHEVVRCFTSIYSIPRTHAVNCVCRDDDDDDDVDTVSRLYMCYFFSLRSLNIAYSHLCVFSGTLDDQKHLNEKHFHSFFIIVIRFAVVVFFSSLTLTHSSFIFHTKIRHFTTEKANKIFNNNKKKIK